MNREEELLRQACEEIAQEETDALRRKMDLSSARQIEAIYKRHQKSVIALLNAQLKKRGGMKRVWQIAACLALVIGAAAGLLMQNAPEPTPLTPTGTSGPVHPYYTSAPTETPEPTPTLAPSPTVSEKPDITPTFAPTSTQNPTETPTAVPTETPAPLPSQNPAASLAPAGWQGAYFPAYLPDGCHITQAENDGERAFAVIGYPANPDVITYSEYFTARPLPAAGDTASYILLNGCVMLREQSAEGVTALTWDQDGRTFRLTAEEGFAEEMQKMAAALQKISE